MTARNIWFGKSLKPEMHNLSSDILCEQCFVSLFDNVVDEKLHNL